MATTQQAIDTKYDYYLALRDEKLKTLFSPVILGWARQNGLNTFEEILNYTGTPDFSNRELSSLNGFDLLLSIGGCNIANNSITDIGDISGFKNMGYFNASNNQLTKVGNISGITTLTYVILNDNNFSTQSVDNALKDLHAAFDAGANLIAIYLQGANMGIPTNGVNNADYVYLTNAGVSVTIRTA